MKDENILSNKDLRMDIIKNELTVVKDKYGDERRSIIDYTGGNFSVEDMIPNEKVVVTISHAGYIKRTSLSEYKLQKPRWGWTTIQLEMKTFWNIYLLNQSSIHVVLLKRKVFLDEVSEIPEGSKTGMSYSKFN